MTPTDIKSDRTKKPTEAPKQQPRTEAMTAAQTTRDADFRTRTSLRMDHARRGVPPVVVSVQKNSAINSIVRHPVALTNKNNVFTDTQITIADSQVTGNQNDVFHFGGHAGKGIAGARAGGNDDDSESDSAA